MCLELVREFFANIHSTYKEVRTLKSYVRGVFLDFSISDICAFHHIQPLDPRYYWFSVSFVYEWAYLELLGSFVVGR